MSLSLFCICCSEEKKAEVVEQQPNIVWFVAEDQSPDFFPMYGDSTISLPSLESLAQDGVVFTNAYAPVPVCAPTRSAIITGMYPTTLGTHNMRTYNAYTTENQPEIEIPSYSPIVPQGTKMFTEYLRKAGYYCTNNAKEDYNFKSLESAWDVSSNDGHWRNRPEDAPFFSVFNYNICHESGIWKQGANELSVSLDAIQVPPYFPNDSIIRHDMAVNYSNLARMDAKIGELIDQLKEDGLYDNTIIFFYGDHGGPFPRHKRALYETGTKVPMVIKFPENKKEQDYNATFLNFIDLAPTVLSLVGIQPPKNMQGKALFGKYKNQLTSKYIFTSSDRFDGMVDRLRAVRSQKYKYIKNFNTSQSNVLAVKYREQMPMMKHMNEMQAQGTLDTVQSLWFKTPKPEEELYDLENDPYELINLADNEIHKDTLVHLRNVLREWIIETNDLGRVSEKELINRWLVNGEQPMVSELVLTEKGGLVSLECPLNDATIIWKRPKDLVWSIYKEPLDTDIEFIAKAVRIGYVDSAILEYTSD
ncbi:MAG: sulfatase [Flavobacteriaceae bacterium]|nr:MAG: sulfatase [Flavobacteriaceae bacterium]